MADVQLTATGNEMAPLFVSPASVDSEISTRRLGYRRKASLRRSTEKFRGPVLESRPRRLSSSSSGSGSGSGSGSDDDDAGSDDDGLPPSEPPTSFQAQLTLSPVASSDALGPDSSQSLATVSAAASAGTLAGVLVLAAMAAGIFIVLRRRREHRNHQQAQAAMVAAGGNNGAVGGRGWKTDNMPSDSSAL